MKDEIKEILSNDNIHIIECDKNWCNAYGYEKSQLKEDLLDYLTNLEQKVEQYENPDDMTLFYMWLDAKAKDKIKQLNNIIDELEKKLNITYKELMPNELVNGRNLIKNIQIDLKELKEGKE